MFTKVAAPIGEQFMKQVRQTPFTIPQDKDGKSIEFVVGLKTEAPFEYCTIGGINFEKYVLPNEASLMKNAGKYYRPNRVLRMLTKKQADALWEEAKKRDVFIPRTKNPKYDPEDRNNEEPQFIDEYTTKAGDWIILEPAHFFDERKYSMTEDKKFQTFETPEEMKQDLIDVQRGIKKGK